MTISTYLTNKDIRKSTTFVYTSTGRGYYLLNGKRFSEAELTKAFPIDQDITTDKWKKENPDGTKAWMLA